MGFFRKLLRAGNDSHFLALDIGSDEIKALVCEFNGKKASILGVGRQKQKYGDMLNGTITDIASIISNCEKAIRQAEGMAGISTKKLIMGISGEFVKGAVNTTKYMRRDPSTKIDLAELKNIIHKVQWKGFEIVRSQIAYETGYNEIDLRLTNATIVETKIDGYKVNNPIGFQGKEISLSIYNSFSPVFYYGMLQTIAAEIDRELISIASEPYALARSLEADEGGKLNAIFIDLGAQSTEIAVMKNSCVLGTKLFALGGLTFTKRLAQSLNISLPEAEEVKLTYSNDKLERQSNNIVREALKNDCDLWLSGVVLTLEEFDNIDSLPSKVFLSGGGAKLPEIKETLETRDWYKSLKFIKKPQILLFNPKMIATLNDETKTLKDIDDIMPLALANLALSYIQEEPLPSKVLKKVIRLMQM